MVTPADGPARQFADERGMTWTAREVQPCLAERRRRERRWRVEPFVGRERRGLARRQLTEARVPIPADYRHGWITFELEGEKRRLAPPPPHWDRLPERELRKLLRLANPAVHRGHRNNEPEEWAG